MTATLRSCGLPLELRHTCGPLLYARTKNIYAASKFLGHANINLTAKIYVHSDVAPCASASNFDDKRGLFMGSDPHILLKSIFYSEHAKSPQTLLNIGFAGF